MLWLASLQTPGEQMVIDAIWAVLMMSGLVGTLAAFFTQYLKKGYDWLTSKIDLLPDQLSVGAKQAMATLVSAVLVYLESRWNIGLPGNVELLFEAQAMVVVLGSGWSMGAYTVYKNIKAFVKKLLGKGDN